MRLNRGKSERALTLIEVLIVIAVIAVLALFVLPVRGPDKRRSARITCINNLKLANIGFHQWAIDREYCYPTGVSTNEGGTKEYTETGDVFRLFLVLSNEVNTPKIFFCPSDKARKPAKTFDLLESNTNISYFIGLDANEASPSMLLSGDRNLTNGTLLPNGILELKSDSVVGWTAEMHNRQGYIALSDGSVQSMSIARFREGSANTAVTTNRLAMPVD